MNVAILQGSIGASSMYSMIKSRSSWGIESKHDVWETTMEVDSFGLLAVSTKTVFVEAW